MKNAFYILLLLILVSCEDKYEDMHRYSSLYRYRIVKIEASKVRVDAYVTPAINPEAAFKIVSNDRYIFVGEMMKGVHVYERTDPQHANPLCFIDCKYLKAFDVKDHIMYCNNYVDLLLVDVENPAEARIFWRYIDFFNTYYTDPYSYSGQQVPYDGKNYELGVVTEQLTTAELMTGDEMYETVYVNEIPQDMNINLPFVGFARMNDLIYAYSYMYNRNNSLVICDYQSGNLTISSSLVGSNAYGCKDLRYEGGILYILGDNSIIYYDHDNILTQQKFSLSVSDVRNAVYMASQKVFWVLSINGMINGVSLDGQSYAKSVNASDVSGMLCVGNNLFTLGNALTVYNTNPLSQPLTVVKQYPDISGMCMARNGNVLTIANKQGLAFYDISNLENIKLIP